MKMNNPKITSLPLVGVWIEIAIGTKFELGIAGHSPWWECGLKFNGTIKTESGNIVTPLGGSVD